LTARGVSCLIALIRMRRLIALAVGIAIAGTVAASGGTAPARESSPSRPAAGQATLPLLPENIQTRGRFNVAVKCDAPPFGSKKGGKFVGVDVEIARSLSRLAFGRPDRVNFTCVATPNREAALTSGSVDLVIATFTYTPERDTRIDFSRAYYKATGRLLVRRGSPVRSLADLAGRKVATTKGSVYDRWLAGCFPDTTAVTSGSFTGAVRALRAKRADVLMWDDTALVEIAATDPKVTLLNDTFLPLPYGIGIQQGNTELKRWVDSRLELLRLRDSFIAILKRNFPLELFPSFRSNVLRPKNKFGYAKGDVAERCP
jgi:polar amino acid transport system substrate-binding protein